MEHLKIKTRQDVVNLVKNFFGESSIHNIEGVDIASSIIWRTVLIQFVEKLEEATGKQLCNPYDERCPLQYLEELHQPGDAVLMKDIIDYFSTGSPKIEAIIQANNNR